MASILLAQEVVRDYHLRIGKPRCTLKIDIMKAFDIVSCEFIIQQLTMLHLPPKFV